MAEREELLKLCDAADNATNESGPRLLKRLTKEIRELLSPARNVETVEAVLTAALAWYEDASIADAEDNENLYESVRRFKNALKVIAAPPSAEVRPKPGLCLLDIPQGTPCAMAGHCLEAESASGEDKIYTKEDAECLCEIAVAASTQRLVEAARKTVYEFYQYYDGPEHSLSCLAEVIDSLDKALPEPEPRMLLKQAD